MRICIICGEEYEDSEVECPYCGYPAGSIPEEKPDFPKEFPEHYSFMKSGNKKNSMPTWLFWDDKRQITVAAGKIPTGDAGRRLADRLRRFQACEEYNVFPKIYEIQDSNEEQEGYYVYQVLDGQSLESMTERQNPLPEPVVKTIEQRLNEISSLLREVGLVHGNLNPGNIWQSEGEIKISDFGRESEMESDLHSIWRIIYRLGKGFWPEYEEGTEGSSGLKEKGKMVLLAVTIVAVAAAVIARIML